MGLIRTGWRLAIGLEQIEQAVVMPPPQLALLQMPRLRLRSTLSE